ncbi:MAG: class I SAM-dependent methyltransferase [Megasphaera sp.]|jgi:tRNA (adenine22-N1)-methyltransferase|nr:class I SAM-dependent methyltransferase [Megasphaera sp.]MCI1248101.1 class I SAM-dependent methyltransferase [Megasphaera sp.]
MKLTNRLAAAAALVPLGASIADIGTDHGYLPVYLCSEQQCPHAIAADIVPGPLQAAISHVRGAGLEQVIDCRLGDGLTCVSAGEVDGAVICGMGGSLMMNILQASPDVWKSLHFLVLQPQIDSAALRRFLYESGWHIEAETLVLEEGRLYELLRAVPGQAAPLPDWQYELGPVNWQHRDRLLQRRIDLLIGKKRHIVQGLSKSRHDASGQIQILEEEIHGLEDIKCQLQ